MVITCCGCRRARWAAECGGYRRARPIRSNSTVVGVQSKSIRRRVAARRAGPGRRGPHDAQSHRTHTRRHAPPRAYIAARVSSSTHTGSPLPRAGACAHSRPREPRSMPAAPFSELRGRVAIVTGAAQGMDPSPPRGHSRRHILATPRPSRSSTTRATSRPRTCVQGLGTGVRSTDTPYNGAGPLEPGSEFERRALQASGARHRRRSRRMACVAVVSEVTSF